MHDCGSVGRERTFAKGHVITIEPGIYLPRDEMSLDFVPSEFRGIAVRLENDYFIDEEGYIQCLNEFALESEKIEELVKS